MEKLVKELWKEKIMSFLTELMDETGDIRDRLSKYYLDKSSNYRELGRLVGVSDYVIRVFLLEVHGVSKKSLYKIKIFLEKNAY